MENQPDDPGDLTDATDATDESTESDATDESTESDATDESTESDATDESTESDATDEQAEPEVPPSPPRNRTALAVGTAAALFVASGAFAGVALHTYLLDRATIATKQKIARTAADTISTLWTYTPEDMDQLPNRSAKYLSGDFQDQYRKFVDAIVTTNKQAQVSNSTQVVAAAVESLSGPDASALVYTNTTSTSPASKVPAMQYVSYRLQLKQKGTDWLVTKMTTITSLDLTPKA